MDCGDLYIKMCEKAAEYLPKKPEAWDYWYVNNVRGERKEVMLLSGYTTDSGFYGPGVGDEGELHGYDLIGPVYRQDQLQAMMEQHCHRLLPQFFVVASKYLLCQSFEQLWLAFVMHELHQKRWDGEDWTEE